MLIAAVLLLVVQSLAHMQLIYPAPFNASNNPHRTTGPDNFLQFPYGCCGPHSAWTYPCRGYMSLLGTPEGAPTATWQAGSQQNWTIGGIGNHWGGSCQIGFSTDRGETFRVVTSYEGNCPHRNNGDGPSGQDFPFTVPADLEPGVQVFAWMWYNREQELNMNCAAVEITTGSATPQPSGYPKSYASVPRSVASSSDQVPSTLATYSGTTSSVARSMPTSSPSSTATAIPTASSGPDTYNATASPQPFLLVYSTANDCTCACTSPVHIDTCVCECPNNVTSIPSKHARRHVHHHQPRQSISFNSRPLMLVADNGNGCKTPRSTAELKFPDPGPDVVSGDGAYPLALPVGNCDASGMLLTQSYNGANGNDGH